MTAPSTPQSSGPSPLDDLRSRHALGILDRCVETPPETELLPLLALSVLATQAPFSGARVGAIAIEMAQHFAAIGNQSAAEGVLDRCASSLEHCGAFEPAADLREAHAILRLRSRRTR
jgi:hypothetical protein